MVACTALSSSTISIFATAHYLRSESGLTSTTGCNVSLNLDSRASI
jgi:hypothetical protein